MGGWQQAMRLGGGAAGLVRAGERRREKRGRDGGWEPAGHVEIEGSGRSEERRVGKECRN